MLICLAMLMILLNEPAAMQPNKQINEKKIMVNVLINAGEPDPSWSITDTSDFEHLRSSLKNLPRTGKPRWPSLGYRGFLLVNQGVDDFPEEVQIFKGVVLIVSGES